MMQNADTLDGLSEYMANFVAQKTLRNLERNDPDFIGKISKYLSWVKQPKGDKEDNDDDDHDEEQIDDNLAETVI